MDQRLDSDEFGPMVEAKFFHQDSRELETLRQKINELMESKGIAEAEFSHQRGKFMEIFKQKEDDLQQTHERLSIVRSLCSDKDAEISRLQQCLQESRTEVNDTKTVAAIAEADRMDEMERLQRKYQDDLASLQSIIKELTFQGDHSTSANYEQEIVKLMQQNDKLEAELQDARNKLSRDKDDTLISLSKTLQRHVGNVDLVDSDEENLEYSMKRAQEDAKKLQTLIAPFEEEISSLKSQLKHCQEHITLLESEEFKNMLESSRRKQSTSSDQATDITDSVSSSSLAARRSENPARHEGIKFIARREWDALQRQLELALKRARGPCDECEARQTEIKSLQDKERQMNDRVCSLEHLLENEKQTRKQLENYKDSLEQSLNSVAVEMRTQLSALMTQVAENESFLVGTKRHFSENKMQLSEQMNATATYRDDLQAELTRLQNENDELTGKHSRFAQQIQEEFINLPNNIVEMQVALFKYREELIAAKVGKEHAEDTLRGDLESLRAQLVQQTAKERSLSQEVNKLREELAIRNSLYSELEQHIRESEAVKTVSELQIELNDCKMAKSNLEHTVQQLHSRIDSLKKDLGNSETIQKDFMQFSQTLQIELNKVRLGEREVRWQHPDDISECESCHKSFAKDKKNCHHCGHVFCKDCLNQSLPSGPKHRPATVCLGCYQSLVRILASGSET